jgi:GT2 family glycosyltransferase
VQRDFLLRFGLFDEALRWHEDIELGERLAAHGMRLLYCPDALGYHHHLLHEADYFRIALREGRSLVQWQRKRRAAGEPDNAILHAALQPALRHGIADTLLNRWTMEPATMAARALARIQPGAARLLYARLFQRIKRQAIDEATAKSSF